MTYPVQCLTCGERATVDRPGAVDEWLDDHECPETIDGP